MPVRPRSPRPKTLNDIVGQDEIKEQLRVAIRGALSRDSVLGHTLIIGKPGLGKTTFAKAVANAMDVPVIEISGPSLTRPEIDKMIKRYLGRSEGLKRLLADLGQDENFDGAAIVVDEVHATPRQSFEVLYTLMEDFQYDGVDVKPFTLIAATTDPGRLPLPFRDRFLVTVELDYYKELDILGILMGSYSKFVDKRPSGEALSSLQLIAKHARGVPRLANNLLLRCLDVQAWDEAEDLNKEVVRRTLQLVGIDRHGLDRVDRKILIALKEFGRPVGIASLASKVGVNPESIEELNEPWLVREGYIERSRSGRTLAIEGEALAEYLLNFEEKENNND